LEINIMKTTDPRDMTWEEIRGGLAGSRERVWRWLLAHGPATTSGISLGMLDLSILTIRPRVCELCQMGLAEITGREGREGIYRALPLAEAEARWVREAGERQPELF